MNIITRLITQSDNAILREEMSRLLTRLFKGEIDPKDVFSPEYQQITDGHSLDYSGFIQHLEHVRSQIRDIAFHVEQIGCHDTLLADRHIVTVTYPEGHQAEIEVYMFATLCAGKICRIHEVTRVANGEASARALAHATG